MKTQIICGCADKTEVVVSGREHLRNILSCHLVILDHMTYQILCPLNLTVSITVFFHLYNIVKLRKILSQSNAEKIVLVFITSRLDDCNSSFIECPKMSNL